MTLSLTVGRSLKASTEECQYQVSENLSTRKGNQIHKLALKLRFLSNKTLRTKTFSTKTLNSKTFSTKNRSTKTLRILL